MHDERKELFVNAETEHKSRYVVSRYGDKSTGRDWSDKSPMLLVRPIPRLQLSRSHEW